MGEEESNVQQDQVVADPGVDGQAASDQGVGQPAPDTQQVPYDRFKEVNDQKKALEDALAAANARAEQFQAQVVTLASRGAGQPTTAQVQHDPLGIASIDDEGIVDGKTVKSLIQNLVSTMDRRINDSVFTAQHPDYATLVGSMNAASMFVPAPAMQAAINEDPSIIQDILSLPEAQGKAMAYRIAKSKAKELALATPQPPKPPNPKDVNKQVAARTDPLSPLALGGGGAISEATKVGQMSDDEFARLDAQALNG